MNEDGLNVKRFIMINEEFTCSICGADVQMLEGTARDHCPYCLCSLHLDINPGDRMCGCHGVLEPVGIEKYRQSYKIVYRCQTCREVKRNIMAADDNMDMIIELSSRQIY